MGGEYNMHGGEGKNFHRVQILMGEEGMKNGLVGGGDGFSEKG
jgi:hypothetical protein